jgi:hypothetical protein
MGLKDPFKCGFVLLKFYLRDEVVPFIWQNIKGGFFKSFSSWLGQYKVIGIPKLSVNVTIIIFYPGILKRSRSVPILYRMPKVKLREGNKFFIRKDVVE